MIQLKGTAEALRCVVPETIPEADLPGELSRVLAEGAHMLSGAKVVLVGDALCSFIDETHDALMALYLTRFTEQLEVTTVDEVLESWR